MAHIASAAASAYIGYNNNQDRERSQFEDTARAAISALPQGAAIELGAELLEQHYHQLGRDADARIQNYSDAADRAGMTEDQKRDHIMRSTDPI